MLGAIIGDTVGSVYEFDNIRTKNFELFDESAHFTDDSVMTLAVMEILQKDYASSPQKIVETMRKWGRAFPHAGYGGGFSAWLDSKNPAPYNSYGNGAAMRVSPVGFYAKTEEEVRCLSRAVTEVTHNHPEGLKGAEVTAMCVFYAKQGKDKQFIHDYAAKHYEIDFDYETLRRTYDFNETCQDTVPQAIFCFLISNDFEDCIRTSVSVGGDTDTLCAISCAIAEAYYKSIPSAIKRETLLRLPQKTCGCDAIQTLKNYYRESLL